VPKTGESGWDRRNRSSTAKQRPDYYKGQRLVDEPSRQGREDDIERNAKLNKKLESEGTLAQLVYGSPEWVRKMGGAAHNKLYPPGARTDASPDESRQDIEDYKEHAASAAQIGLRPMDFGSFVKSRKKGK
jgi:hypothetical protein